MGRLFLHMLFPALLAFAVSGCATRSVDVVQADQFKLMADRMSEELIARNILDKSRNYSPGMWSSGENYGDVLFARLSPEFLEDSGGVLPGPAFSDSLRHSDRVEKRATGFTIRGARRLIKVDMVAITDWDGDGRKDWIVAGEMQRTKGAIPRIYYVVIPEPAAEGLIKGTVAAVYEDLGVTGRLYMRESQVKKEAPKDGSEPSAVEEAVPGLKSVTVPPGTPPPGGSRNEGVKERSLD